MTRARRGTVAARTCAAAVLGVLTLLAATAVGIAAAPGAEATTYRYWTYWSGERPGGSATWTFSSRGPASDLVKDGSVLGWRFAVTSQAGTTKPRHSPAFATACPALAEPVPDRTRVALVVDYGTQADAPPGQSPPLAGSVRVECLTFPSGTRVTGVTVLDEAAIAVRTENGLLCALDSYPKGECAPVIAPPRPSATPTKKPSRAPSSSAPAKPSPTKADRTASPSDSAGTGAGATPSAAGSTTASASSTPTPAPVTTTSTTEPSAPAVDETLPAVAGTPVSAQTPTSSAAGFVGGALLIAAVGGAAWWTSRRRGAP